MVIMPLKAMERTSKRQSARDNQKVYGEFSDAVQKAIGGSFPTQYKRAGRAR